MSNSVSWVDFLRSRSFIIQLILGIFFTCAVIFGTLRYLDHFTHHNEEISVPDLSGVKRADLPQFMEEHFLQYVILDSVYAEDAEKGVVVGQNPPSLSKVKTNRTIYLTISAMQPPQVKLPLLIDKSLRQAASVIENVGLVLGELSYIPDQCLNCVLRQVVDGDEITADTMLPKGTRVNLVLGGGLSSEKIIVPFLLNLTREEAVDKLKASYLNLGGTIYDESVFDEDDSLQARIFAQYPAYGARSWVQMGSSIDVEFTTLSSKIDSTPPVIDSTLFKLHVQDSIN